MKQKIIAVILCSLLSFPACKKPDQEKGIKDSHSSIENKETGLSLVDDQQKLITELVELKETLTKVVDHMDIKSEADTINYLFLKRLSQATLLELAEFIEGPEFQAIAEQINLAKELKQTSPKAESTGLHLDEAEDLQQEKQAEQDNLDAVKNALLFTTIFGMLDFKRPGLSVFNSCGNDPEAEAKKKLEVETKAKLDADADPTKVKTTELETKAKADLEVETRTKKLKNFFKNPIDGFSDLFGSKTAKRINIGVFAATFLLGSAILLNNDPGNKDLVKGASAFAILATLWVWGGDITELAKFVRRTWTLKNPDSNWDKEISAMRERHVAITKELNTANKDMETKAKLDMAETNLKKLPNYSPEYRKLEAKIKDLTAKKQFYESELGYSKVSYSGPNQGEKISKVSLSWPRLAGIAASIGFFSYIMLDNTMDISAANALRLSDDEKAIDIQSVMLWVGKKLETISDISTEIELKEKAEIEKTAYYPLAKRIKEAYATYMLSFPEVETQTQVSEEEKIFKIAAQMYLDVDTHQLAKTLSSEDLKADASIAETNGIPVDNSEDSTDTESDQATQDPKVAMTFKAFLGPASLVAFSAGIVAFNYREYRQFRDNKKVYMDFLDTNISDKALDRLQKPADLDDIVRAHTDPGKAKKGKIDSLGFKKIATLKAMVSGNVSEEFVDKFEIKDDFDAMRAEMSNVESLEAKVKEIDANPTKIGLEAKIERFEKMSQPKSLAELKAELEGFNTQKKLLNNDIAKSRNNISDIKSEIKGKRNTAKCAIDQGLSSNMTKTTMVGTVGALTGGGMLYVMGKDAQEHGKESSRISEVSFLLTEEAPLKVLKENLTKIYVELVAQRQRDAIY